MSSECGDVWLDGLALSWCKRSLTLSHHSAAAVAGATGCRRESAALACGRVVRIIVSHTITARERGPCLWQGCENHCQPHDHGVERGPCLCGHYMPDACRILDCSFSCLTHAGSQTIRVHAGHMPDRRLFVCLDYFHETNCQRRTNGDRGSHLVFDHETSRQTFLGETFLIECG